MIPVKKLTPELKNRVLDLIDQGVPDYKIIDLVFVNENGHHTGTYGNYIRLIRKSHQLKKS